MPTKPTLQTVADAVGVSRSTVSNAYSRPDQLSPALRERIHEAARRLGYSGPDPAARSLRSGRAGAIGVLFTADLPYAFTDPYAVQFLRGLAESAQRHGTGLLLVPIPDEDEQAAVGTVRNAVVDGFCVYCVPGSHGALAAIRSRGLPMVIAEQPSAVGPEAMFVGIDEQAAARRAAGHVATLGHRRVAVISDFLLPGRADGPVTLAGPEEIGYDVTRARAGGFRDALAEVGVAWSDMITVHAAANSREHGALAASYALDRADRPTAILAVTDLLALGALDAVLARGLRPGRDISVTGFDDIPEAAAAGLTTIRQPAVEKGVRAGELLLDPPADPTARQVLLPTELVVRASTGPAPAALDGLDGRK
ncbi:LacI family DNA-binding transcriptional regulator [Solwaraspora sp. WMMD1047]|uniref:LacI family DNA-binding transcriptional regulator n=1 Tax=Solwaraspora sp. WMMD1047 TaxID=3016102 RepID=UPI00241717CA|nr:LacI family DNA-binding transcriptional regulator [Solwaraspora sp. WMMD1047]MDG4832303.1 LacI family DNA-binding transcriptional regulator [Solwaraspora sp. WMMD1047]